MTLNRNQLKLLAIAAMTTDHITWLLFPGLQHVWYVMLLHAIGRLTAPIMWFFLAEGIFYTRSKLNYIGRLFVFGVLSHFAYNFAFGNSLIPFQTGILNQTSIMWSLTVGAVLMVILNYTKIGFWVKILAIVVACIISIPADWSCVAVMAPNFLYTHRKNFKWVCLDYIWWSILYVVVYFFAIDKPYGLLQFGVLLVLPFLKCYDGTPGKWKGMKWFFYIYYPAHLVVIGLLRLYLYGNYPILF